MQIKVRTHIKYGIIKWSRSCATNKRHVYCHVSTVPASPTTAIACPALISSIDNTDKATIHHCIRMPSINEYTCLPTSNQTMPVLELFCLSFILSSCLPLWKIAETRWHNARTHLGPPLRIHALLLAWTDTWIHGYIQTPAILVT
jgi:hypothetical protein